MNFNDQFTVFPDTGDVELHCAKCVSQAKQVWRIGYHPGLDRVIEEARKHNEREHNDLHTLSPTDA